MEKIRCPWAKSEKEIAYHDEEWCIPEHDDRKIFEFLILEGMQAGLSWSTILNKREHMSEVFDGFDPLIIAEYSDKKKQELLSDPGIIRNRLKIDALITNAKQFLQVQAEFGSFERYIWSFVDGKPLMNAWTDQSQMPATDEVSDRMSRELKKRGFKFVGSTICYSFMQAIGMVNDHVAGCFCKGLVTKFRDQ